MRALVYVVGFFVSCVSRSTKSMIIPDGRRRSIFEEKPESGYENDAEDTEDVYGPNADETGSHHEGDIVLPGSFERQVRAVTNADYRKWMKGIIPYTMDQFYSSPQRQMIYSAMDEIRKKTCVNFVERTSEADYVRIMPGEGCSSYVGRRGGQQVVTLDPWRCLTEVGVVAHELLHVLGFYHEHTRLDRDDFINIMWNNMEQGREVNFHKRTPGSIDDLGKQYDYNSVMHYSAYAFSRDERRPTLTPRSGGVSLKALGQRRELSSLDVAKVNAFYGCDMPSPYGKPKDEVKFLNYMKFGEDEPLYTRRTTSTPTTTTEPPPPTTTGRSSRSHRLPVAMKMGGSSDLNPCDAAFGIRAVLTTTDGSLQIFGGSIAYRSGGALVHMNPHFAKTIATRFWVIDPHRYISKGLVIGDYYPDLPDGLDAAFTWINGHTYFFKDNSYWMYQGFEPLEGYPQDIKSGFPGLPDNLDAAFVWSEGRIAFVKDQSYWVLHPKYFNEVRGPLPLRSDMGFPSVVQAGLEWPSSLDTDLGSDVWLIASGLMYPLDSNVFQVSSQKQTRRLMDWLRCDLYDPLVT